MNARQTLLQFVGVPLVALAAMAALIGCSSDSSNPKPTSPADSGAPDATVTTEASTPDTGASGDDGGGGGDDGGEGGGSAPDAACVANADGGACNPCTTPVADPYNACSPYVSNCIHFDNSRVPSHPAVP